MVGLTTKAAILMSMVCLIIPYSARSADMPGGVSPTADPVPPKHHHKHKKKASVSATSNGTVAPEADTGSNRKTASVNTDAPGMSDSLGTNNPGSPNMGSPDHTPGTTGTSGQ